MQETLVVTPAHARKSVYTDSRGGGEESQGNLTGDGECHLFLAGIRVMLLGNRRFSWREMACTPSFV